MTLSAIAGVSLVTLPTSAPDPVARREHAAVTADVAAALGLPVPLAGRRFQVRLAVTAPGGAAGANANFTVAGLLPGEGRVGLYPSSSPRAADGGVHKLFAGEAIPEGARAILHDRAPSVVAVDGAAFGPSFAEPSAGRYFREAVTAVGGELLLAAPHGGHIEVETSAQVAIAGSRLAVLGQAPATWDVQGVWGGGETLGRWHIASADLNPASFPGLAHLLARRAARGGAFPHAAALHGFDWGGERAGEPASWKYGIVLGGRAPLPAKLAVMEAVVERVGAGRISFALADRAGDLFYPGGPSGSLAECFKYPALRGLSAAELVNRLSPAGGLKLQQSRGVRERYACEVALGLADALARILASSTARPRAMALAALC